MLVSDFKVNSRLKYSKVFLWNPWNVLMRMHSRKKKVGRVTTLTSAKLLDI